MPYPLQSNFSHGPRNCAWWIYVRSAPGAAPSLRLAATDGYTFVRKLQEAIRARVPATQLDASGAQVPRTSFDGQPFRTSDVRVDGIWGLQTTRGLWALLYVLGAPDSVAEPVADTGRLRSISRAAVAAACWAYSKIADPAFAATPDGHSISLPEDARPPTFNMRSAPPPGWNASWGVEVWDVDPQTRQLSVIAPAPATPPGATPPTTTTTTVALAPTTPGAPGTRPVVVVPIRVEPDAPGPTITAAVTPNPAGSAPAPGTVTIMGRVTTTKRVLVGAAIVTGVVGGAVYLIKR